MVWVVMEDIRQQVREGATPISFGDPDFFNGPTHGLRLARGLHDAFPVVTFDATIKIQHLIDHAQLLPELRGVGSDQLLPVRGGAGEQAGACIHRFDHALLVRGTRSPQATALFLPRGKQAYWQPSAVSTS